MSTWAEFCCTTCDVRSRTDTDARDADALITALQHRADFEALALLLDKVEGIYAFDDSACSLLARTARFMHEHRGHVVTVIDGYGETLSK